jgi:hypothetical protein
MPKPFLFIEPTIVKRSTMECSQIQCENILHSILCNRGAAHISDFRRRNNERLGCDPALQLEGLFIHPRFSRAWLSSVQHRLKPVQQASLRLYGNDRSDESALPKLPHGRHACLTLRISLPPPNRSLYLIVLNRATSLDSIDGSTVIAHHSLRARVYAESNSRTTFFGRESSQYRRGHIALRAFKRHSKIDPMHGALLAQNIAFS